MAISDLKNISKDDILAALGLETRHTMATHLLPSVLMFGVGLAAGFGLGMLFAPKSGDELRDNLGRQYRKTVEMAQDSLGSIKQDQSSARPGSPSTMSSKPV